MTFLMNSIIKKEKKEGYRADWLCYQIGKGIWLPFCLGGIWFAQRGYDRYGTQMTCAVRRICGFPCPGCGGTRAFYYLFKGELIRSLRLNPAVLFGLFAYLHFMLLYFYRKRKAHINGKSSREDSFPCLRPGGMLRGRQISTYTSAQKEIHMRYYAYGFLGVILIQWLIKMISFFLSVG